MEEVVKIHKSDGSESGVSRSMKTGQKKRFAAVASQRQKICGKDGMKPSRRRRRDYRATRTSQYSASVAVRLPRQKRMQFCGVLFLTCVEVFFTTPACSGGKSLFGRNPTLELTSPPCCHVPGPSRCIHATTCVVHNRESGGTRAS